MRSKIMLTILVLALVFMVWPVEVSKAAPMGTAWTYQGRLMDANDPAEGVYEFEFKLYDSVTDGNQLDGTVAFRGVDVIDGYFTVELDFGGGVFDGDVCWLEIGVRSGETADPFTTLSPRHEVTPTPYALYAENASADNDWMVSGNNLYSIPTGNVGIGTANPDTKLHISGAGSQRMHLESTSAAGIAFIQTSNGDRTWQFGTASSEPFIIQDLTAGPVRMVIDTTGNVGIGTVSPETKLHIEGGSDASLGSGGFLVTGSKSNKNMVIDDNEIIARNNGNPSKLYLNSGSGNVVVSVLEITGGSDLAEPFEVAAAESIEPGMVAAIDPEHPGQLRIADKAYDRKVAGIISGAGGINPGMLMGQKGSVANGANPVALTGRVYCLVDAAYGAIMPGDLLTTSDTPGHAMKVTDYSKAHGAILGKAMSSLDQGQGLVLVLVTLQ